MTDEHERSRVISRGEARREQVWVVEQERSDG